MFYSRTDLACEAIPKNLKQGDFGGVKIETRNHGGIEAVELNIINELGASIIKRSIGKYITIYCGRVWLYEKEFIIDLEKIISQELKKLIYKYKKTPCRVLICGLGNRHITSDSLGPLVIDNLDATGHLDVYNDYKSFLISPGVMGESGIEAYDSVLAISRQVNADLVLIIDALASKGLDRLCTTIQISDSGICPGSGIGNSKKEISKSTLGIPVISIGVPTVIDSSTLVYEALNEAKIENISYELEKILNNNRNFFVSPKDSDIIVSSLASIISNAIALTFKNKNEIT